MVQLKTNIHAPHFSLEKISESGQCFRWRKLDENTYLIPARQTCVIAAQPVPDLLLLSCDKKTAQEIWIPYFALDEAYDQYISAGCTATCADNSPDPFLRKLMPEADGIRVLRQELWETLVSFLISQNNNIPRIQRSIDALCSRFGTEQTVFFRGSAISYHTFPTPEQLYGQDLSDCGLGYRDKYISKLAADTVSGVFRPEQFNQMSYEEARELLLSLLGVGIKVANCVLLFGLGYIDAFPIDTWIRKMSEEHYGGTFPLDHYPGFAGIIQQFIFYYLQKHKADGKGK